MLERGAVRCLMQRFRLACEDLAFTLRMPFAGKSGRSLEPRRQSPPWRVHSSVHGGNPCGIIPAVKGQLLAVILLAASFLFGQGGAMAEDVDRGVDEFVDQVVESLSTEEKIGQLVMVSFGGPDAPPDSDISRLILDD